MNHCVPGIDGKNYAGFGLIPSIVTVPAYAGAYAVASFLHRDVHILGGLAVTLFHALFAAIVPVVLSLWFARIGLSRQSAVWAGLLYAFASPAWVFSKGFYSEPYFAFGLVACCYFLSCDDKVLTLLLAGAFFGFGIGARIYGLILTPAIALYALMLWRSRRRQVPEILKNLLILAAPIAVAMGLIALSNLLRFGGILKTGYHLNFPTTSALMSTPILMGMKGLLIDPEVGLLVYVPWIAIVPFLVRRLWIHHRSEAILGLVMVVINFVFFAKYTAWHGGWTVGPRMLYAAFPFLILALAECFEVKSGWRTVTGRILAVLLAITLLIQSLLILYPWSRYYTLGVYYQEHRVHVWWNGSPILAAVAALPELLFGVGSQSNDPAHQFLLTFPNSVNLVRADLWLLKASLLGVPRSVAYLLAVLLALTFILVSRATLARLPRLSGPR